MKVILSIFLVFMISLGSYAQAILKADGPGQTYELIKSVFAPDENPLEPPDCSHPEFGRHIDEIWDSTLNEYVFRFFIHVVPDDDRCLYSDRQRNEIKIYDPSPATLKGFIGDSMVYKWRFKLDLGFQSSSSFTHIHQLKGVGGDEINMPLITFTPRKGNPDRLQLRYAETTSQVTLVAFDLEKLKGKWVSVTECVRYNEEGSYSVTFTDYLTGEEIYHYENNDLRMWRTGASFFRPKWGIYRSLSHPEDLRDEELLFNEFYIKKFTATSIHDKRFELKRFFYPNPVHDYMIIRSDAGDELNSVKIFDLNGKVVFVSKNVSTRIIDVSNLDKGFYFVELKTKGTTYYQKMIKD
jgi:hypothetical protein